MDLEFCNHGLLDCEPSPIEIFSEISNSILSEGGGITKASGLKNLILINI